MTDREIMQQTLNALEYHTMQTRPISHTDKAIEVLRQALAQPEQEPVAWMVLTQDDKKLMLWGQEKPPIFDAPVKLIPLYTAPPKREWVGLTQEEVQEIAKQLIDDAAYCSTHFAIAIEAELRRKNNAV